MRTYYVSREGPSVAEIGEKYWRARKDPDGRVRDMTSVAEGKRKLRAMAAELNAVALAGVDGHVLDVGCGVGWAAEWLAHRAMPVVGGRIRVGAVEPDSFAASLASEKLSSPRETVYVGSALENLVVNRYEAALCYHVIEHVPEPIPFARQLVRCVKPGGLLVIGTPDFDSHGARQYGKRFRMLHDPTHVSLFTTRSLCALLEDLGCSIERVDYPAAPKRRAKSRARWSPPMTGNIVTVYARRGSEADENEAARQTKAWDFRESSDLLGVAKELV